MKKQTPMLITTILRACALGVLGTCAWAQVPIAVHGKARCVIVTQADASPAERHAARELADTPQQITGAPFATVERGADAPEDAIIVGPGAAAQAFFPEVDLDKFGGEQLTMRSRGRRLLLAGDDRAAPSTRSTASCRSSAACAGGLPEPPPFPIKPILLCALSRRLYIWDYTTNFAHYVQPHPNWFMLGPNLRFFHDHGARGVFEQGAYQSSGSEMAELRAWVLAQLLWKPDQDDRKLIREFLDGYYGKVAPAIWEYMTLLADKAKGVNMGCYASPSSPYLEFATLSRAERLWQRAEAAVKSDPGHQSRHQSRLGRPRLLHPDEPMTSQIMSYNSV